MFPRPSEGKMFPGVRRMRRRMRRKMRAHTCTNIGSEAEEGVAKSAESLGTGEVLIAGRDTASRAGHRVCGDNAKSVHSRHLARTSFY